MEALRHAVVRQHLGLADLGAADADRAGGELPPGDLGGLVRLGVRAQLQRMPGGKFSHGRDVAIERAGVDQQRRRVQAAARSLLVDQRGVKVGVGHDGSNAVAPAGAPRCRLA